MSNMEFVMSGIRWSGNRMIQRVKGQEEELGYLELEPNSKICVLWLKDTFGVVNTAGGHIRADEYPSMAVARAEALDAPSVRIWHLIWMRGVVKREAEQELDNRWEDLSASAKTVPSKEGLRDRIRAHVDRLPSDKIQELFKKVGTIGLREAIAEIVKRVLDSV